jgi:hypothetical protein
LSVHKRNYNHNKLNNDIDIVNEINKLKNEMISMVKNSKIQISNSILNSQINSNNKNEIKIFLSEYCSNALSIQEFVKQLTITFDDLMQTKDNTTKGITHIVEKNLKPLSLTVRPVHHIEKNEWFMKDKDEWTENNGDDIVDKTHAKIQREYLLSSQNEIICNDDYLCFVKNGTKELSKNEKDDIKTSLYDICKINI